MRVLNCHESRIAHSVAAPLQFRCLNIAERCNVEIVFMNCKNSVMIREMLHKRRKYFCQVKTRAELIFWTDIGYLTISDFTADFIAILFPIKSRFTISRQTTLT